MFTDSSLVLKTKSPLEAGAHQCVTGEHPLTSFRPKVMKLMHSKTAPRYELKHSTWGQPGNLLLRALLV